MQPNFNIRKYDSKDQEALLNIFSLNVPVSFAPEEKDAFQHYLNHDAADYFVLEYENNLVGSGGVNFFDENSVAFISWDLLHPDMQQKGLGTELLKHRIHLLQQNKQVKTIVVRTAQTAYLFYEKNGFVLQSVVKNYWAEGFDLYYMEFKSK